MVSLKINGHIISVEPGTTILSAARMLGYDIPALCYNEEVGHFNSCMICLVKDNKSGKLIPSCSTIVHEGMDITVSDEEITEARRTGLELLLSDHVGDCDAPCTIACPAHMDIPQMNRLLASGNYDKALKIVKQNIALPAVLGYICPAPCEGACRRKPIDGAVSICMLKRFSGERGNFKEQISESTGFKVAIIGSGPAGLSAAYYLQKNGVQCTIFEKSQYTGGMLRISIDDDKLPKGVLDHEISEIENIGVTFLLNSEVDKDKFDSILREFDSVIIATGLISEEQKSWGISFNDKGFIANDNTFQTNNKKVFAAGNALRSSRLAIRSLAQGKEAATAILQMLKGDKVVGQPLKFNSKFAKLIIPEYAQYLKESVDLKRIEPVNGFINGLTEEEVKNEASRCMHCDCRKATNCMLRDNSDIYNAQQKHYYYDERKPVRKIFHDVIVYEPEKCIKCGICVRITEKYKERYGLTYIGRGFEVEIGVPFNESINEGLREVALKVADSCPTGSISKINF